LWEIVETPDDYYVAIGDHGIFIKIDRDGSAVVGPTSIHTNPTFNFPTGFGGIRGNSIQMVADASTTGYGFVVAGNTSGPQNPISHGVGFPTATNQGGDDMLLLRLDAGGHYVWSNNFGGAGSFDQGNAVTVLPNGGGFVIVGRRTDVYQQNGYSADEYTECPGLTDNQAYIVRTDMNGNATWETSIDATDGVRDINDNLISNYTGGGSIDFGDSFYKYEQFVDCYSGGFDYEDPNETDIPRGDCSVPLVDGNGNPYDCANTSNENAIDVLVDNNGDIVLSVYFHYNDRFDSESTTCTNSINNCPQFKGYKEADIVLVKLRETDGHPIFAENVAYFSAVDFNARLAEDSRDGGYAIIGATASQALIEEGNTNNGGGMVNSYLVKTDSDGQRLWARAFNDPANINSCSFGVAATTDGGFIVVGNNNVNGDDRIAVKLYGDCQPNVQYSAGYEPSTLDLLVSSGEIQNDLVIGRHIVIGDGVSFFIDPNTRLQFADTRQLNDYDDLANYPNTNIHRAGITVEPGGTLSLGYNVILEGIDGCAKTITKGGNDMWEGIEVLTDPVSEKIGKVNVLQNDPQALRISDAFVGIRGALLDYDDRGHPVSVRNIGQNDIRGGSMSIQNIDFNGNLVDIEMVAPIGNFPPIQNEYFSVDNCRFVSTELADPNFIGATSFINIQDPFGSRQYRCEPWGNQVHIRTEGFGGSEQRLVVSNSLFDNSNFYNQMGAGIESISSSIRVENGCSFNELQFGISASVVPYKFADSMPKLT